MYNEGLKNRAKDAWYTYSGSYRYNLRRASDLIKTGQCRYLSKWILDNCPQIGLLLCEDEKLMRDYLHTHTDKTISNDLHLVAELPYDWYYSQLKAGICDDGYAIKQGHRANESVHQAKISGLNPSEAPRGAFFLLF